MGFEKKQNTNKNAVVLSMVSKATGSTASWVNLTDTFARKVCGCEVKDVTIEILIERNVPAHYNTELLELHMVDTTVAPTQIAVENF